MPRPAPDHLSSIQQTILACVSAEPGQWSRSSLAKLLAGSRTRRSPDLSTHPEYGRLTGHGRKAITFEVDILLQQGFLSLDPHGHLLCK